MEAYMKHCKKLMTLGTCLVFLKSNAVLFCDPVVNSVCLFLSKLCQLGSNVPLFVLLGAGRDCVYLLD